MTAGDVMSGSSPASGGNIQYRPVTESDNLNLPQFGTFFQQLVHCGS